MTDYELDIIRKRVLMLAEEYTEEGKQWRNVVNAFVGVERDCENCIHHVTRNGETGCELWKCEYEKVGDVL